MSKPLAARLAPLTVLDERGHAAVLGSTWEHRSAVVAFVRHFGWIFCRQQVAGLKAVQPAIAERGGALVVLGPARPEHIAGFRAATGYDGALFVDPSLGSFREAGLAHGWVETFHPLAVVKGVRAFASGFRQGVRQGNPIQQGGTFVLGPGDAVRFEWRDRHAGDHPDLREVLAALDPPPAP